MGGAGATLAREERARTTETPAASGVTARGWWKCADRATNPQAMGGCEVAALFLRLCSAGWVLTVCKNGDGHEGAAKGIYTGWIVSRAWELRGVATAAVQMGDG